MKRYFNYKKGLDVMYNVCFDLNLNCQLQVTVLGYAFEVIMFHMLVGSNQCYFDPQMFVEIKTPYCLLMSILLYL